MEILDIDGKVKTEKEIAVNCPEDSIVHCFTVARPEGLSAAYFIRLKLTRGNDLISENFYWSGLEEDSLKTLSVSFPKLNWS